LKITLCENNSTWELFLFKKIKNTKPNIGYNDLFMCECDCTHNGCKSVMNYIMGPCVFVAMGTT
jgi:hypothetical protein